MAQITSTYHGNILVHTTYPHDRIETASYSGPEVVTSVAVRSSTMNIL